MRYEASLDGIRAVAVTLVLLCHFGALDAGWIGVQLFFVLSGFLITGILLGEQRFSTGLYLGRFYVRRTLRIFPVYYGYLAGLFALAWLLPARFFEIERPEVKAQAVALVTYTLNFSQLSSAYAASHFYHHFWSLAVEEQFYLVWPWIVRISGRERLGRVCWTIVAASPVFRCLARWFFHDAGGGLDRGLAAAYGLPFCQADAFALGALLALRMGADRSRPFVTGRTAGAALGLLALNAVSLRAADLGQWSSLGVPSLLPWNAQHVWGYTLVDVLALWLIERSRSAGALDRVLSSPWIVHLGRRSYAFYVLHLPALDLLGRWLPWRAFPEKWIALPLIFLVILATSELTYWAVERPFLMCKDRLTPSGR